MATRFARHCCLSAALLLSLATGSALAQKTQLLVYTALETDQLKAYRARLHDATLQTWGPDYPDPHSNAKAFGNHKIHSKLMIIDPFGTKPQMLFGSANFSDESCRKNDENAFITRDPRLIAIMAWRRQFDSSYYTPVEVSGLYWHFVDIVWILIFTLVYLIPA